MGLVSVSVVSGSVVSVGSVSVVSGSVSTGSACSSKSLKPSHVLEALGVPVEMIHGTVRFTVGDFTTKEDIDYVVDSLKEVVEKLRMLSPVNEEKGW